MMGNRHMREEIIRDPPETKSRDTLSQWMCNLHNKVNERLGKPLFNCDNVYKRWRG